MAGHLRPICRVVDARMMAEKEMMGIKRGRDNETFQGHPQGEREMIGREIEDMSASDDLYSSRLGLESLSTCFGTHNRKRNGLWLTLVLQGSNTNYVHSLTASLNVASSMFS